MRFKPCYVAPAAFLWACSVLVLYASAKAQHGASEIQIQPRVDSSLHI